MAVQPQKFTHKQTFEEGMNTVLARELMQRNQARFIFNCHIRSSSGGNIGVVTNIKGNLLIETPLPLGISNTMGSASAEQNNKFYFFTWNSLKLHCIFEYDEVTNSVSKLLENITDTGGVDIMRLDKNYLILHADVVGDTLHWVDGLNPARKTNYKKLIDKTDSGYGETILESFISAYKQTAPMPPTAKYISDTTKKFNRFYGQLTKYAVRYVYADGEKSVYSDFSSVILPDKEPFTGINMIPTNNNGMEVDIPTGSREVVAIELIMQSTAADIQDGVLNWVLVATINKKRLKLADESFYKYTFYNDTKYPTVDQTDVQQPYSFMMKAPACQAIGDDVKFFANGKDGFPVVDLDVSLTLRYEDLFLDSGVGNDYNEPYISATSNDSDIVSTRWVTRYDGVQVPITGTCRFNRMIITIGPDVKKGNTFNIYLSNGYPGDTFTLEKTATNADTALTVANDLKQKLIGTERIFRKTPDMPDTNIYDNTIVGGAVTFAFLFKASPGKNYVGPSASVNPVQFQTLKDTGQSLRNYRMGSVIKLGIEYEDFDQRKSLTYTVDALIVSIKPINEDGIKTTVIGLQINHKAPSWARYFQIMRTQDLRSVDFVDVLVQKVVEVPTQNTNEYLDLVIGSFFTYQKLHPNTTLNYQFEKGDRISLKKKIDTETMYPFFETEVLSYNDIIKDTVMSNVVVNGTATVTVAAASATNIGKFIVIDGHEREIVGAGSTTYDLNNVVGVTGTPQTYLSYDLIDRRGVLRIRKPDESIVIVDNSLIQVYKPIRSNESDKIFYAFQKKFKIINPGTDNAYHSGNVQDQTDTLPALIDISEGDIYVRFRELPVNNVVPGTQVVIDSIEDPSYSDFYQSFINDNGRVSAEDNGLGEIHFGRRVQHSSKFFEGTGINGLNNFRYQDKRDYNSHFGNIKLTVFEDNRLIVYKELKTGFINLGAMLAKDNSGQSLLVQSGQMLNDFNEYAWEGGVGGNPESYASNGTHRYYLSPNSGVIIRFGGNGEEPISKTFYLDNTIKELIAKASKNGAKMYGGFDRENETYIIAIEGFDEYIYFDGFNGWIVSRPPVAEETLFEVVTMPANGTLDFTNPTIWRYQGDLDFVGHDTWSYRAFINGEWTQPVNVCLDVIEPPVNPVAWRAKLSSYSCQLSELGLQTGYVEYDLLEEYYVISELPTGNEKPNDPSDIDYVFPILNEDLCVPEPIDDTPDPYSFTPVVDADVDELYESDTAPISGINVPVAIGALGGFQYRVNGGDWVTAPSTVVNGDIVQIRRNSSTDYETLVTATLIVGGVSADFDITTKAASLVDVDYSIIFGTDPYVSNGLLFTRNGTEVFRSVAEGSGTITGVFFEGDTIGIRQISYEDVFPWPPLSNANLTIEESGVEVYNEDVTVQTTELQSDSFIIPDGSTGISAVSTGSSTAVGYLTHTLTTDNGLLQDDLRVSISDNTGAVLAIDVEPNAGSSDFNFNALDNADLLTMVIYNQSADVMAIEITGVLGYTYSTSINPGDNVVKTDVPKGSVTVTATAGVGNEYRSVNQQKDDCTGGEIGTVVVVHVDPDTYFAPTLAEANALADAWIDANKEAVANSEGYCLAPTVNSIALVDMYNDDNYDVGVYIDTPGVAESGVICYTGQNFYLPTDPAATAFLLASDPIIDFTNKRRFAINVGKLIGMYPDDVAIPEFIFKIRGRSTVAGIKNGAYSLKDPSKTLIMTGSPGTYMCGATPAGGPAPDSWSAFCPDGGDGSIGMGIGAVILTFTYNRAANTFIAS